MKGKDWSARKMKGRNERKGLVGKRKRKGGKVEGRRKKRRKGRRES